MSKLEGVISELEHLKKKYYDEFNTYEKQYNNSNCLEIKDYCKDKMINCKNMIIQINTDLDDLKKYE